MDKFVTYIISLLLVVNSGFSTAVDTVKSKIIPTTEINCPEGSIRTKFGNNYDCLSNQKPEPSQSPIAIPTSETAKPKPTTDPDPIVTCLIHKDCGGGSTQLKSSVCYDSVCCQIGDKWIFYQSKDKCTQDQNAQLSSNPNSQTSTPTSPPSTNQQSFKTLITIPCNTELGSNIAYGYSKEEAEQDCKNLQNSTLSKLGGRLIDCEVYVGGVLVVRDRFTQAKCDELKTQAANPPTQNNTPKINEDNISKHGQCVRNTEDWWSNQGTQCGGSCAEAIRQLKYSEYKQKLKECDQLYPI